MTPADPPETGQSTAAPRYLAARVARPDPARHGHGSGPAVFGHEVFIPVALTLLFAMVLSNAVEGLHRLGLPRAVSAFLMLLILITGIGAATDALIEPAQKWLASAPTTLQMVERKIRPAERWMHRLEGLTHRAGEMGGSHSAAPAAPASSAAPISGTDVLSATGATLAATVTIIILTLFLLSGGPPMLARMAASLGSDLQAVHYLRAIDAIRSELGRYYGTIALVNVGLGASTAVAMLLLGVPNPYLWGAVAAVLNFIPYVGSATTLLLLAVVALVSFDDLGHVFAAAGSYLALATIEGQVLQPLLVGRRLDLNPILVFLAVWFGAGSGESRDRHRRPEPVALKSPPLIARTADRRRFSQPQRLEDLRVVAGSGYRSARAPAAGSLRRAPETNPPTPPTPRHSVARSRASDLEGFGIKHARGAECSRPVMGMVSPDSRPRIPCSVRRCRSASPLRDRRSSANRPLSSGPCRSSGKLFSPRVGNSAAYPLRRYRQRWRRGRCPRSSSSPAGRRCIEPLARQAVPETAPARATVAERERDRGGIHVRRLCTTASSCLRKRRSTAAGHATASGAAIDERRQLHDADNSDVAPQSSPRGLFGLAMMNVMSGPRAASTPTVIGSTVSMLAARYQPGQRYQPR